MTSRGIVGDKLSPTCTSLDTTETSFSSLPTLSHHIDNPSSTLSIVALMDWLYSTSETQTAGTDASGKPCINDTWEARVLGKVVYKITKQGGPSATPTIEKPKPATVAERVANESHWLDVDRTADSRTETPELDERTVTNVGVLGFNVWGSGNGDEAKPMMEKESHWLDVDRIADSRAESPVLDDASPTASPTKSKLPNPASVTAMSPTKKRELVGSPLAKGG
ncbi:hypothetical protein CspeluHIS016_0300090 [Cutaneotrichosporon spelunceum]|uniref:Uncharacterized protein n=1 Tax=Cutaneotrichosporon spelunceum TaxID=1672016 RepID=A0AAD3YBU7_9TREE|nr:hypothetical protein CspeluHIS016_0300090 [Cutaneotrichosporon spelunceum]